MMNRLKNKILNKYNNLQISNYNYYNTFKKTEKNLSSEKEQKALNKEII